MNKRLLKILIIYLFAFYISIFFKYYLQIEHLTNFDGVSDKATDGVSDKATDGVSDKATDGVSDKATDGVSDKATDGVSDKATDGVSDKAIDGVSDNSNTDNDDYNNDKFQMYGPTNYLDPKDMTIPEKLAYKNMYPANMTLQDYVNWLLLYENQQEYLSIEHVKNIKKILRGEQLVYIAGRLPPPTKISPPLTSSDYFDNLYSNKNIISNPRIGNSIHNDNMMTYNSDDYGDFKDNYDVYGSTGRSDLNPDLPNKKDLKNFKSFDNEEKNDTQLLTI
jgi:hypothetical protein